MMNGKEFFKTADGMVSRLYSLRNASGFGADVTDWGGALVSIFTPDRDGKLTDVLLGFGNPAEYTDNGPFFGALIGRYANRITEGSFPLDGKRYQLPLNDANGHNTLHGGLSWGRRLWQAKQLDAGILELTLTSPDGDAGFPGKVEVKVVYRVTEANELEIDYRGVSDAVTVLSMTNHAYFNLNGAASGTTEGHRISIAADRRTEVNHYLSPTGKNLTVAGTAYDLRAGKSFARIFEEMPAGFDDNFVIGERAGEFKRDVASVVSERTGISVAVSTTEPGIQLYMGFFLDGSVMGKEEVAYPQFSAFCLETQLWPDAVNHPDFPSARLEPGQIYQQKTVYRFGVER